MADLTCVDLKHRLFLFAWRTGEMIGSPDKYPHEFEGKADSQFVYRERQLPSIAVFFEADVWLSSFDGALEET